MGDRLLGLEEGAHQARGLDQARVAQAVVVAVRPDVLPLARRKNKDRAALREVLRGEELLGEDRRTAADRVEHPLPDAHAAGVLAEDAHQRLQRELRGELGVGARTVAQLGRPQGVRMLELQLVAGPDVVEACSFQPLRRLDHLLDRRVAPGEGAERERLGIQARHAWSFRCRGVSRSRSRAPRTTSAAGSRSRRPMRAR